MTTTVPKSALAETKSAFTATPAPSRRQGGMFYRWHIRRERIRELRALLNLDASLLSDIGVTSDQVRAQIITLRRSPL